MISIGITGGRGVIGKILQKKLQQKNYKFHCFEGDITKLEDIVNWISNNNFNQIIHLAAIVPVNKVNENLIDAYNVNVGGTLKLLDAFFRSKVKPWLFYASTSHVYASSSEPLDEEGAINPINLYGFTKSISEDLLINYAKNENLQVCIGRIFSFYHETQLPPYLYPTIMQRLKNEDLNLPFKLIGANSIRDIVNAEFICDLIIKLLEKELSGVYNIGSGKGICIKEFVQSLTTTKLNFVIDEDETPTYLVANINKLKTSLTHE